MEETIIPQQTYELAVHLRSEIAESELKNKIQEIEGKINSAGGSVIKTNEPFKAKFAYPIRQSHMGQFLNIEFSAPKASILELDKGLKLNEQILRHAITIKVKEAEPRVPRKNFVPKAKPTLRAPEEKVEVKQEELDKKLEEILGNI